MTVEQLRRHLANLPDDMPVVFRTIAADFGIAPGQMVEWLAGLGDTLILCSDEPGE